MNATQVMAHDPTVARGLRFIWDHHTEQLSVEDVAAAVGVGRSTICRKFKHCLKRSVNAELRRKRLEHFRILLRKDDTPVGEVAKASGFPSKPYVFKAFRETYGMTPGEFRQQKQ